MNVGGMYYCSSFWCEEVGILFDEEYVDCFNDERVKYVFVISQVDYWYYVDDYGKYVDWEVVYFGDNECEGNVQWDYENGDGDGCWVIECQSDIYVDVEFVFVVVFVFFEVMFYEGFCIFIDC